MAPAFAILASNDAAAKVASKNSASAGVQLFQRPGPGLLGREDLVNCLINFRRTNGVNGQSRWGDEDTADDTGADIRNMWGEIAGTGLAGGGTGAAGKHGDTSKGKDQHDGVCWAFKRGEQTIGPVFSTWTHDLGRIDGLCMPWLDAPGRAGLECEYSVCCRLRGSTQLSQQGERRQLAAIRLPNAQVATAESCEAMAVQPGRWYDVPGLTQISYTDNGEKALGPGGFSIFRDGQPLDPEHFGLQSVRAMQKGLKSVAARDPVMTIMDEPEEGPHVYEARCQVRAAVTTADGETRVCHIDAAPRQLGLLKLPASAVSGPNRPPTQVWSTNFNPEEMTYEAYFTVMRSSSSSGPKNLGSDQQGLWSVASSASGSSAAWLRHLPGCLQTRSCS
eukprot:Skav223394  [mRNA]  locus=scaffold2634:527576:536591:- [translate_table: standard]